MKKQFNFDSIFNSACELAVKKDGTLFFNMAHRHIKNFETCLLLVGLTTRTFYKNSLVISYRIFWVRFYQGNTSNVETKN